MNQQFLITKCSEQGHTYSINTMASYKVVFKDERKNIIIDDIRTFILLGDKTIFIHEDDKESSFLGVFSISGYFYDEG